MDGSDRPDDSSPHPDVHAFGHLLHDVASRLSGLEMVLRLIEGEQPPLREGALIREARENVDWLIWLIQTLGQLRRFMLKHGSCALGLARPDAVLGDVLDSFDDAFTPPIGVTCECDSDLDVVAVDRALLSTMLALGVRTCATCDRKGTRVFLRARRHGRAIAFEAGAEGCAVPALNGAAHGGRCRRQSLALEHFWEHVARQHGGEFERCYQSAEQFVRLSFTKR